MTPQHWKTVLPLVQAFAEGKKIQQITPQGKWVTLLDVEFRDKPSSYRIAPDTKTSRRYWWKGEDGQLHVALATQQQHPANFPETWYRFVKWIDKDWVEYELPTSTETGG